MHRQHSDCALQPECSASASTAAPEKAVASAAAALASRISELRLTIEQLAKQDRALVTAPGQGVALKPLCERLAAAASECLALLEQADLLPDEPYLSRLVEAEKQLSDRSRVIHHRRSAGPAFSLMWAMSRRLDTLGKYLLLCIGQPRHPLLATYVSRVGREPKASEPTCIQGPWN